MAEAAGLILAVLGITGLNLTHICSKIKSRASKTKARAKAHLQHLSKPNSALVELVPQVATVKEVQFEGWGIKYRKRVEKVPVPQAVEGYYSYGSEVALPVRLLHGPGQQRLLKAA